MPLEPFKASAPLTMGVELELQLVSPTDFDLTPAASDLLHCLNRRPFPGDVKPEIAESMIELATSVQTRHEALLAQLRAMRDTLVSAAERLNLAVCGGGAHPFQRWFRQRIVDRPRFHEVSWLYGYLAKQFTVFGQHIHLGCASADEALYLVHALNRYLPHFIALSASSPFHQGVDTLFDSSRLNAVFAFPLSGRAPFILSWQAFAEDYFARMEKTGIVKSMKDFYWDIRPKPEYGTIELRVCDTPLAVERAAALAAYLQALCAMLRDERWLPDEDDYLVYHYNRFQACRFGLDGFLVHPRTHEALPLRDDIRATLARLGPYIDTLDSEAAMSEIASIVEAGNDARDLRDQYAETGSLMAVVETAVRVFRGERR